MSPADDARNSTYAAAPFKPLAMKAPGVAIEPRADGSIILRSTIPLQAAPRSIAHLLAGAAAACPDRAFLRQRAPGHGPWRTLTYAGAERGAHGVAQWLLDRGLGAGDCVMILSANAIEQAMVILGGFAAGVPVAPVSPAYSLVSRDHAKLKHCFSIVRPKVVFAQNGEQFAPAFETLRRLDPALIFVTADGSGEGVIGLDELTGAQPGQAAAEAMGRLGHASVAKYMFTSGSTGLPKAAIQTHGMMANLLAGQLSLRTEDYPADPPITLEWMPWSHISAGNVTFTAAIAAGGTIYLDDGRPTPGQFEATIRNLHEISPTAFSSAPIAYAMLAEAMERDGALRASFFRNMRHLAYGGAILSGDVADRMQALAVAETGRRMPLITMYGATETQGVTMVHWLTERVGLIGLPMPNAVLKLVPNGDKYEVRAKGPTITPGYHNDPERTAQAFDEEGFYKLGDAARFLDPDDPLQGLVFDGRVTEDFKLESGSWVSVGTLRPELVAACSPFVQDAVIAGQNRPYVAALFWPSKMELAALEASPGAGTGLEKLTAILAERLRAFNATAGGSSRRVGRFAILADPPSIDAGEITDKGYVNQRAALEHRRSIAEALYADPPPGDVHTV